jgi:ribosome-binding protein aMBF1 (putative translation factor)
MSRKKQITDGMEIIKKKFGVDPRTDKSVQEWAESFCVAQLIYDARTRAGLTQSQLAEKIGTTQSVISQLEDADYEGHSLTMLRRVADALGSHVEIRLVPDSSSEPVS